MTHGPWDAAAQEEGAFQRSVPLGLGICACGLPLAMTVSWLYLLMGRHSVMGSHTRALSCL